MESHSSLCHPDEDKSCFFCCPPLRPPGYDPLQDRRRLDGAFRFARDYVLGSESELRNLTLRPINGWACWGLGYLDEHCRTAGCLLHPFQNNGKDYRYLVDYGNKCARELCFESMTFKALGLKVKSFYLAAAQGMDSFEYSSRKHNPIHGLLLWGKQMCEAIALHERFSPMDGVKMKMRHCLLLRELSYKTDGYFVERIVAERGIEEVLKKGFLRKFRPWRDHVLAVLQGRTVYAPAEREKAVRKPVHLLPISLPFSRFVKFSLNIWEASFQEIEDLKRITDEELDRFVSQLS